MRARLAGLSLLWRFSLLSLVSIGALGVVLATLLAQGIRERALAHAEHNARLLAGHITEPHVTASELRTGLGAATLARLDEAVEHDAHVEGTVKIFGPHGRVVYSNDRKLIGEDQSRSEGVRAALAGAVESELEHRVADSGGGAAQLEVYAPVVLAGERRPAGVFELYVPYAPVAAEVRRETVRLYAVLAIGLAVLWLALFPVVAGASRTLRRTATENRHRALHDELTGLPNRSYLIERATRAIERATSERMAALLFIDLDRFKEVNDTLGHDHGDLLLRDVAERLSGAIREGDTLARLGGDEFAVLATDLPHLGAVGGLSTRIAAALERPFEVGSVAVELEASVGVALHPLHADDVQTLIRRADVAMYEAKQAGTQIKVYDAAHDPYTERRLMLAGELRGALAAGQIAVHFQPQVELPGGAPVGVEALVRWHHPERGLVLPAEFVPLAERTGVIDELTRVVLGEALAQLGRWRAQGHDLQLSVNLAARNLLDTTLPGALALLLDRHGVPPHRLTLEVSERTVLGDGHGAVDPLMRLRTLGVKISLDDFGTGQSSLAHLQRLPLDELKIDRSFVLGLAADGSNAAIVRSTVDLARGLGLALVAEGVETADVQARVAELGCTVAQGFLFGRPLAPDELTAWLEARAAAAR